MAQLWAKLQYRIGNEPENVAQAKRSVFQKERFCETFISKDI